GLPELPGPDLFRWLHGERWRGGIRIQRICQPVSSPPQFGEVTGVVIGGVREGENLSGSGGITYSGGPLNQISDRDIVRTLLAIPWPPGAGVALVLRSYGVSF